MGDVIPFDSKRKRKNNKEYPATPAEDNNKIVNIRDKVKIDLNMAVSPEGMQVNMDTVEGMMIVAREGFTGVAIWFGNFKQDEQGTPITPYDILIPYDDPERAEMDIDELSDMIEKYRR